MIIDRLPFLEDLDDLAIYLLNEQLRDNNNEHAFIEVLSICITRLNKELDSFPYDAELSDGVIINAITVISKIYRDMSFVIGWKKIFFSMVRSRLKNCKDVVEQGKYMSSLVKPIGMNAKRYFDNMQLDVNRLLPHLEDIERILIEFFSELDARVLEYGVNMLPFQATCNVYLISEEYRLERLAEYFGGKEYAQRYIDEAFPKSSRLQHECYMVEAVSGKRGRPKLKFDDCLKEMNEAKKKKFIQVIRIHLEGRRGISVAIVIMAALEAGYMVTIPSFAVLQDEFHVIGSKEAFRKAMNNGTDYYKDAVERMCSRIKSEMTEVYL